MKPAERYRALAEFYDAENEHLSMLQRDVPFFLGHLPARRRLRVLELAVGTGRAAIPIAQAGHRVVGVDYAPDMLAIARRKRDALGLGERQLALLQGDILRLNLRRLGDRFDWVCIFFNTFLAFTTLQQQDRLLQTAAALLRRGGKLWVDIFHPDFARLARPRSRGLETHAFYVPRFGRTVVRTVDVDRDVSRQLQNVTFRYQWFDEHGRSRRRRITFAMTYLVPRELQLLMERNGFRISRL
jgi:SAM-dependent methyltransferase